MRPQAATKSSKMRAILNSFLTMKADESADPVRCQATHITLQSALSSDRMAKHVLKITRIASWDLI